MSKNPTPTRVRSIIAGLLVVTLTLLPAVLGAQTHPRLLFGPGDIPDLRAKILNEPYKSMYEMLLANRFLEDSDDGRGNYLPTYPAVRNAFLYVLTGDTAYADTSLTYVDQVLAQTDYWAVDSFRSLGRAMMGKGVALAYDFCSEAWDPADQTRVSQALEDMAHSLMRSGGGGWPGNNATANNWHGVRYSAAILCFLACDETGNEAEIEDAGDRLVTHLLAKYGSGPGAMGWDVEGAGYVYYPWGSFMGAAVLTLDRLEGRDIFSEAPAAQYAIWATYNGGVPLPTWRGWLDAPGLGLHPDFSDSNPNMNGEGSHGLAFALAPDAYVPGIKWVYNRMFGALGAQTWDSWRHGEVYSILYYPDDTEVTEQNPENVWGLYYADDRFGTVSFRDRYQDDHDLVTQTVGKHLVPSNTHRGADIGGLRIFGLGTAWTTGSGRTGRMGGQSTVFTSPPFDNKGNTSDKGLLSGYYYEGDGSGYADVVGSSTGVLDHKRRIVANYSQESGARGVWVVVDETENGSIWRLNTPEMNVITTSPGSFTITAPNGNQMVGTVLHPVDHTITTGLFDRGSGFTFGSVSYENNNYVDVTATGGDFDGNFVIVLTVHESGQSAPSITPIAGDGLDQHFTVNGETYLLEKGGLLASGWTDGALAPVGSITYPVLGQYVRANEPLTIKAHARDLDGSVSEVRFYEADTLVYTDTSATYRYPITSIAEGERQFSVVAVDNEGNESIPTSVTFLSVVPKNPYIGIEAENYDDNHKFRSIGDVLGYTDKNGWTRYNAVDFGENGPATLTVEGSRVTGGTFSVRLGSKSGPVIATFAVDTSTGPYTGVVDTSVPAIGLQDMYLVRESGGNGGAANIDRLVFTELPPIPVPQLTAETDGTNVLFRFNTETGYSYQLETTDTLDEEDWTPHTPMSGTGGEMTESVPMSGDRMLGRVVVERE